ncbi:hypothetical protein MKZ38_003482 [Zalerion maritima]|uniref:Uncharacterized protein n=1 Tax=Zalerion maritima TaxID=339359 RepID=A0AAD5RYE1_9PEZI|nr:hypothetical protein MKZ38_003482 [Zalerion maritima]
MPSSEASEEQNVLPDNWLLSPTNRHYRLGLDAHLTASDNDEHYANSAPSDTASRDSHGRPDRDEDRAADDEPDRVPYPWGGQEPRTPGTNDTGSTSLTSWSRLSANHTILTSPHSPTPYSFTASGEGAVPHFASRSRAAGTVAEGDGVNHDSDDQDPRIFADTAYKTYLEVAAFDDEIEDDAVREAFRRNRRRNLTRPQIWKAIMDATDRLERSKAKRQQEEDAAESRSKTGGRISEEDLAEALQFTHSYPPWSGPALVGDRRAQRYVVRVPLTRVPDPGDPDAIETILGWSNYEGKLLAEHEELREEGHAVQFLPGNPETLADAKELLINTLEEKTLHLGTIASYWKQEVDRRIEQGEVDNVIREAYKWAEQDYKSQVQDLAVRIRNLDEDLKQKNHRLKVAEEQRKRVEDMHDVDKAQFAEEMEGLEAELKRLKQRVFDLRVEKRALEDEHQKATKDLTIAHNREVMNKQEELRQQSEEIDHMWERLREAERTRMYSEKQAEMALVQGMDHLRNPQAYVMQWLENSGLVAAPADGTGAGSGSGGRCDVVAHAELEAENQQLRMKLNEVLAHELSPNPDTTTTTRPPAVPQTSPPSSSTTLSSTNTDTTISGGTGGGGHDGAFSQAALIKDLRRERDDARAEAARLRGQQRPSSPQSEPKSTFDSSNNSNNKPRTVGQGSQTERGICAVTASSAVQTDETIPPLLSREQQQGARVEHGSANNYTKSLAKIVDSSTQSTPDLLAPLLQGHHPLVGDPLVLLTPSGFRQHLQQWRLLLLLISRFLAYQTKHLWVSLGGGGSLPSWHRVIRNKPNLYHFLLDMLIMLYVYGWISILAERNFWHGPNHYNRAFLMDQRTAITWWGTFQHESWLPDFRWPIARFFLKETWNLLVAMVGLPGLMVRLFTGYASEFDAYGDLSDQAGEI